MENNKIKCRYCGKEYTKRGISRHERLCKENPNRDLDLLNCMRINGANTYRLFHKRVHEEKLKDDATRQRREFICKKCGKKYFLYLTDKELSKGKYRKHCTRKCANTHVVSDETKKKISIGGKKLKDKNFITKKEYAKIAKIFLH